MLIISLILIGCSESTPYDEYNEAGYTVSVKYDANGGMFTTSVDVIVDSYKYSDIPIGSSGNRELALRSPDDESRGKGNYYSASRAGYFLAGWYTDRIAVIDEQGRELDENGNVASESGQPVAYSYSGRWDFEKGRLQLDPNETYDANKPITLYAAWVKNFKYEFYSLKTGKLISEYSFDPNYIKEITLPFWNTDTGMLDVGHFPSQDTTRDGNALMTLNVEGIYLSEDGTEPVVSETLRHKGTLVLDTAVSVDNVMKVYIDYLDGEWYRIYKAEHFVEHSSSSGNYEIMADLDFTDQIWKTSLMYGNFRGNIIGNGHVFKNINIEQTDTSKQNAGLFGRLMSESSIKDITLDNVTFTVQNGTRIQDVSFGLLCGTLDPEATLSGVTIENSRIEINASAGGLIGDTLNIGLVCGSGWTDDLDISYDGITYEAVGDTASDINIQQEGNGLRVTFAE